MNAASAERASVLALVGNPNSGKTTLFNALTGLRQKVANYPGVTVERKEGSLTLRDGTAIRILDLPGLYSLIPHSPDEQISRDALLGYLSDTPRPDALVNVLDSSNLERNLYLTSQLAELGIPMVIVLTMADTAARRGIKIDPEALAVALNIPVLKVHAAVGEGLPELHALLATLPQQPPPPVRGWRLPQRVEDELAELTTLLQNQHGLNETTAQVEAIALLGIPEGPLLEKAAQRWSASLREHLRDDLKNLSADQLDAATLITEARYAEIGRVVSKAVTYADAPPVTVSERLDHLFLHRFWGYAIFLLLLAVLFQGMFSWAEYPKGWIQAGVDTLSAWLQQRMPPGDLRDLIVSGVLGGVGNTITFLPQILLLFLFISLLEDTGYLARAAFLMDRLMSRVGLHGKSFIPLLSSYSCAIPGILATRTIESSKARLLTILVAPLMSCSARIPIYSVMIGAFVPDSPILGITLGGHFLGLRLRALTLFALYALGTIAAFVMASIFNRVLLKGETPTFLLEMPPYRKPDLKTVILRLGEVSLQFLQRAGTVILAISTVLWFLVTYPKQPEGTPKNSQLERSYAGRLGQLIEPTIAPLGFDWKMGIGLVSSFAAREVFVTAMGTIYNLPEDDEAAQSLALPARMKAEHYPDGKPVYTPLVAICLMVFYVLAMQCMSTVAVVRRETNSWKWPLFQLGYMTALAWIVTFLVRWAGVWLVKS